MLANMRLMQSFISLLAILPCVSSSQSTATSGQHNSTEKWPADDRPLRNQTTYKPRFAGYRDTTPVYNPRILPRVANDSDTSLARLNSSPNRIDARLLLQEDGACAPGSPCTNGACCSGESGFCGYGPDFCGPDVCISNCDAQAQCGPHAPEGEERCPLNVCCSVWGFCGTTPEFCEDQCDPDFSDCGPPPTPDGKALAFNRNIGYYASWAASRPCDAVHPDDLDLRGLTHLYFSFAFFHPTTFRVTAMDANAESLLRPFTDLKRKSPRLQTWIAIGGWSFNDPGNVPNTRTAFSDMARTAEGRKAFIDSLIRFMDTYGFDGADLDWEYPSAEDRGGRPDDTENLVTLCREMRQAFGTRYGLSIAIPASYWYLRHFDVGAIQNHVDWINVMTYDIHGVWDADNQWTGPYARPHTNLTQIDEALGLYWRAGVRASKITLGLAYYGRSFTLTDPSCNDPGCRFTEGARPGECTGAAGVLSLAEIERIRSTEDVVEGYDMIAAVKWMTWDSDQWVSFEDEETFHQKIDYASRLGLGGTMIWAVDMAVLGPSAKNSLAQSTNLAAFSRAGITEEDIVQYVAHHDAGESCYVSFCSESCAAGYTAVQTMRGEVGSLGPGSACEGEEYQTLCCVSGTIMHRCSWHGWRGQGLGCYGGIVALPQITAAL
ncbi:hypothetical protein SODALDRAFT_16059 [Sodiomyces alkalinus F11]|uniref:chitinase n=1 Tax=Sodiomyces alkalinus (strain CBS 110278 / VKM F-3762 / F11) TaxID=1314773 RepID=A0A3N2Q6T8_SODAK|nr:hypothetical protein SODALDRAFT_16059 [Sodiomyces alkalinus F11]ROT42462.1 hypothetical protein SODALDRAFT_16059 [Sodiomyces alkalinus F11]